MKIRKKTQIEKLETTYNLHVEKNHNYVANGAVVSNCHQAKADALKNILTGPLARVPIRWGLTGTIPKENFNQLTIACTIGHVVHQLAAKALQDKGVLAQCQVNIRQFIDVKEFGNYQAELKYLLTNDDRQDYLVQEILRIAATGNTLVLVDRVQAGKDIVTKLNTENGVLLKGEKERAVFVSGATKNTERQEHYDDVAVYDDKIIVATYGVAAIGLNIPRIFNLVLLEPGKSFVRVIQSIGRGIRKAKDKDFVQIWDLTSTCKFAKRHLRERKKFYKEAQYEFNIKKVDWN